MRSVYNTEKEIIELVRSFDAARVSRDEWRHAEHLVVALYFVTHFDLDTAIEKMRSGIFRLLEAFGVDLTKEMPYHETLTVFWMRTVYSFSLANREFTLAEKANGLVEMFDKNHPLKFYTRDLLFSDRARNDFVEPDIAAFEEAVPDL